MAHLAAGDHVRTVAVAGRRTCTAAVGHVCDGKRHAGVPHHHAIRLPSFRQNANETAGLLTERQSVVEGAGDAMTDIEVAIAVFDGWDQVS